MHGITILYLTAYFKDSIGFPGQSIEIVTRIGQIRHELYLLEQHPTYLAQTQVSPPQNSHSVRSYHTDVSRCPDDLCLTVEDDDDTSVNDFSDVSSMTGEGDICESRDINDDERYDAEHAYMQFRKWRRRVKRFQPSGHKKGFRKFNKRGNSFSKFRGQYSRGRTRGRMRHGCREGAYA